MATTRELLDQARRSVREVQADEVAPRLGGVVLLDVREADEYEQGALPAAVHVPRGLLEFRVEARIPDKTAPVVVYCAVGERSVLAAKTMAELGYQNVVSLAGGFTRWKEEGRSWEAPPSLACE
jgi:rhodanese-related sulfurtransferase